MEELRGYKGLWQLIWLRGHFWLLRVSRGFAVSRVESLRCGWR